MLIINSRVKAFFIKVIPIAYYIKTNFYTGTPTSLMHKFVE